MDNIRKQIIDIVKRSERILLMPSTPVDGDSLGSSLALYLVFKKIGKQVTVVCADPIPDVFKFLPTTKVISSDFTAASDFIVTLDCEKSKIKTIRTKLEHDKVNIIITAKKGQFTAKDVSFEHGPSQYDLIITVDTADLEQLGRFYEDNPEMFVNLPLINIDHHASNSNFGKINLVDMMSSATTELLIPLIRDLETIEDKKLFDEDIATLLLAGIITDTGSFQNANTTPRSFAAAAQLIKYGARQQEIIHHVFKTKHLSTLKLWGRILTKLSIDEKHRFVWSTITKKDFADTGSREDETGGIIDELMSNAPETDIIMLIKEKKEGLISGSIRTIDNSIDASAIAEMFGGGGHTQAAGFKIESDDMEKTVSMIIGKVREFQKSRLNLNTHEEPNDPESHFMAPESEAFTTELPHEPEILKKGIQNQELNSSEGTSVTEATPKDELTKSSKPKLKSVNKRSEGGKEKVADTAFTDVIIKKDIRKNNETELEDGVIYKFED